MIVVIDMMNFWFESPKPLLHIVKSCGIYFELMTQNKESVEF